MRSSLLFLMLLLPAIAHAQAPPATLTSPNPEIGGSLGEVVSGVPDADGDGLGDLLVGARGEGGGAPDAGRAYLYSGASGALLRTLQSPNPEASGEFGVSVAGVPDANGDGRGDLLVGAWQEDGGAANSGRAYLFSGATGALLRTLQSPNPETISFFGNFGEAVSGVPDANGDGRGDLLVGARFENGGPRDAGRAYLFSGATGALLRTLTSPNAEADGSFGVSVSGAPDANGDGRGDLLVGARGESGGAPDAGRAYLFSGATGTLLRTLTSPNPGTNGEFSVVSGVPDTNGDGRGDLLVGAPDESPGGAFSAGRAYLFSGATGTLLRTLTSLNIEQGGAFGEAVSGVLDADGDGRGDLLVGASGEDGGTQNAGRAYLFSGATGALLRTLTSPNPESLGDFGVSVSGAPDADGDGRGDLLVGAQGESGGAVDAGRAYLFPSGSGGGGITVTASGNPTTIPPGGTITVTGTVSNTTSALVTGDLWVVATRGGTPVLTQFIVSATVPVGATLPFSFDLTVPGSAPPGVYAVAVNVGLFPNAVVASDAFNVTVTGSAFAGDPSAEPFVAESVAGDVFADGALASSAAVSSSVVTVSPNPFAGQTALRFALDVPSHVRLSVHDGLGREVALLVDGEVEADAHAAVFDARGLASGVYVWRLVAGNAVQTGRLTLLE